MSLQEESPSQQPVIDRFALASLEEEYRGFVRNQGFGLILMILGPAVAIALAFFHILSPAMAALLGGIVLLVGGGVFALSQSNKSPIRAGVAEMGVLADAWATPIDNSLTRTGITCGAIALGGVVASFLFGGALSGGGSSSGGAWPDSTEAYTGKALAGRAGKGGAGTVVRAGAAPVAGAAHKSPLPHGFMVGRMGNGGGAAPNASGARPVSGYVPSNSAPPPPPPPMPLPPTAFQQPAMPAAPPLGAINQAASVYQSSAYQQSEAQRAAAAASHEPLANQRSGPVITNPNIPDARHYAPPPMPGQGGGGGQ